VLKPCYSRKTTTTTHINCRNVLHTVHAWQSTLKTWVMGVLYVTVNSTFL